MNELKRVQEFLKLPNVNDHMHLLLTEYIKQEDNGCSNLLFWIPQMVSYEINKLKSKSQKQMQGIEALIHIYGEDIPDDKFVVYTIQAVMNYFPDGEAKYCSERGKKFFNRFVECLRESRDELIDSYWAKEIHVGCNEYLKKVLIRN